MLLSGAWLLPCLLFTMGVVAATTTKEERNGEKKPNILFIITDDQDGHMESLEHMPLLQKYIIEQGTTFENHFCTIGM